MAATPPVTTWESESDDDQPEPEPKLSYMGNYFPGAPGSSSGFQINREDHDPLPVEEVTENRRFVMSCRPVLTTLKNYIENTAIEARVYENPNGLIYVRRYAKSVIQGLIIAVSSCVEQGLRPPDDPSNYVIFPERFVPNSYHFMDTNDTNPFFAALRAQTQYKPCVEVNIINSHHQDGSGPLILIISGLHDLIFTQILGNQTNLAPEWKALDNSLRMFYEKSRINQLSIEDAKEEWKCCEAHGVFMSWVEKKNLIEKLYNWRFHSDNVLLQSLVHDALRTVPELYFYLTTWVNTVQVKKGPLLKILNFRSTKRAYKVNNVDDFVTFLRNSSVHLCDKDLNTGKHTNIDMTQDKEKHYAQEGYLYLVLTRWFPDLFVKLNEFLIRKKAPPY